jgi:hypothetical protein
MARAWALGAWAALAWAGTVWADTDTPPGDGKAWAEGAWRLGAWKGTVWAGMGDAPTPPEPVAAPGGGGFVHDHTIAGQRARIAATAKAAREALERAQALAATLPEPQPAPPATVDEPLPRRIWRPAPDARAVAERAAAIKQRANALRTQVEKLRQANEADETAIAAVQAQVERLELEAHNEVAVALLVAAVQ